MILSNLRLFSAFAFLLFSAALLPAQGGESAKKEPMRVGFVDIELVIENSRALRRGLDAMDDQLSERARTIDRQEREFRSMRFELDRQERILSQEERERRRAELVKLQDDINRMRFEMEAELREKERLIEPVLAKVMNVVGDIAERDGYDLVLRGEVVIWGSKAADLTDDVIAELDARTDEVVRLFQRSATASDASTTSTAPVLQERKLAPLKNEDLIPLIP
ncbi:MAG: outer membrane protein [Candidatus Sumerlaeota bacterium]|nr:outer membrane protein [Candidatus Sumerlaeota bacterium]